MNTYICHYGILGMHWGVRRFQNEDGSLTSAGKERYNDGDGNDSTSTESAKKGLTDSQKKAIVAGAAFVGTALAVYGGYKLYKSGALDGVIEKGKDFAKVKGLLDDTKETASGFKKLKTPESVDDILKNVNPSGSHENCYNCVVASILRKCGFDVIAKGDTQGGKGLDFDKICKAFGVENEIKRMDSPTVDRLTRQLEKRYKDGDIGAIAVEWNNAYKRAFQLTDDESAAHTFNFTIENGKARLFDSQSKLDNDALIKRLNSFMSSEKELSFCKLANKDEPIENIKDIVDNFCD